LVVVRASPVRDRTSALLESIVAQDGAAPIQVVVISPRRLPHEAEGGVSHEQIGPASHAPQSHPLSSGGRGSPGPEIDGTLHVPAEPDWTQQILGLAETSGCRWVVLPSSVDRYLPGAFKAISETEAGPEQSVVGGCLIRRDGRQWSIGPRPFRFDYFALLQGFAYIAPGAVFIDARSFVREGGFDAKFPHASAYEYLLRTGAAAGVASCSVPLLETEAEPFPGVPAEVAPLHALETLSAAMAYNRHFLAPGAVLGLGAVLSNRLEPMRHETWFYDGMLLKLMATAQPTLAERYLEYLEPEPLMSPSATIQGEGAAPRAPTKPQWSAFADPWDLRSESPFGDPNGLRGYVKAVLPTPAWHLLRRARRAWTAFTDPLL